MENPEIPIAPGLQFKAVVEYTPKCAEDLRDKLTLLVDDDAVHIPVLGYDIQKFMCCVNICSLILWKVYFWLSVMAL